MARGKGKKTQSQRNGDASRTASALQTTGGEPELVRIARALPPEETHTQTVQGRQITSALVTDPETGEKKVVHFPAQCEVDKYNAEMVANMRELTANGFITLPDDIARAVGFSKFDPKDEEQAVAVLRASRVQTPAVPLP